MADGHYFDPQPNVASRPSELTLPLPEGGLRLQVDRGVFAARAVDPGTLALLAAAPAPAGGGDLLDLGCGYGPIACALARRSPDATVWALDRNQRALELCRANAAHLGLTNLRVATAEEIPAGLRFRQVWSNPPIRIGKVALRELLVSWLGRLAADGEAWLVVQRHLGADSLAAWLAGEGYQVARHASKRGYRVLHLHPAAPAGSPPAGQGSTLGGDQHRPGPSGGAAE